jgi:hypothetical protein
MFDTQIIPAIIEEHAQKPKIRGKPQISQMTETKEVRRYPP